MSNAPQVVIVGSGPAGVSAAWPLVRAGIRVLMIDASKDETRTMPSSLPPLPFRTDPDHWKDRFGEDLAGFFARADVSPKLATPKARAMLDDYASRNGLITRNFLAAGSLAAGGLSNIWGALAQPFDDEEFAAFPFDAAALRPSYEAVIRRIGVSGGPENDATHLPSAAARCLYEHYLRRHRGGLKLHIATNAVLDAAKDDREACTRCGRCLYGCASGSIYNSALELPALQSFANFTYGPGRFVRALRADDADHLLEIERGGAREQIRASVVILAAGTIATTGLALRRLNWLERSVRLLTNPSAATAFVMPKFIGRDLSAHAFSLGQIFYRVKIPGGDAAGVIYGAEGLPLDLFAARLPFARPFALRLAHALAPALLMTTCYVPGSLSRNSLRVHGLDGNGSIHIEGTQSQAASAALLSALAQLRRAFVPLGALPVPVATTILQPGADAHYAGTLPMGGEGPISTSLRGELTGCPGIFVADGASLTALPATHPTLTIMANANRIGSEIARRLKSGEIADAHLAGAASV